MFKINDYIVYGPMSVCKIIDIIEEENPYIGLKSYYVIQPVYSDKSTIIKIPVDSKKVFMRHLISQREVLSIIESIPNLKVLDINNDKQRSQQFKSIIKSININEQEKLSSGKKLSKTDEDFKKTAKKLINEEFATVLNIPVEEVSSFILNHLPK